MKIFFELFVFVFIVAQAEGSILRMGIESACFVLFAGDRISEELSSLAAVTPFSVNFSSQWNTQGKKRRSPRTRRNGGALAE